MLQNDVEEDNSMSINSNPEVDELETYKTKLDEAQSKIEDLKSECENLNQKLLEYESEFKKLKSLNEDLSEKLNSFSSKKLHNKCINEVSIHNIEI